MVSLLMVIAIILGDGLVKWWSCLWGQIDQAAWLHILALPLPGCMTLDKSFTFSWLLFPYLYRKPEGGAPIVVVRRLNENVSQYLSLWSSHIIVFTSCIIY